MATVDVFGGGVSGAEDLERAAELEEQLVRGGPAARVAARWRLARDARRALGGSGRPATPDSRARQAAGGPGPGDLPATGPEAPSPPAAGRDDARLTGTATATPAGPEEASPDRAVATRPGVGAPGAPSPARRAARRRTARSGLPPRTTSRAARRRQRPRPAGSAPARGMPGPAGSGWGGLTGGTSEQEEAIWNAFSAGMPDPEQRVADLGAILEDHGSRLGRLAARLLER